jgi:hypothetical protein
LCTEKCQDQKFQVGSEKLLQTATTRYQKAVQVVQGSSKKWGTYTEPDKVTNGCQYLILGKRNEKL